jgi:hypothetical protein
MLMTREYAVPDPRRTPAHQVKSLLSRNGEDDSDVDSDLPEGARTQQEYTVSGAGEIQRLRLENFSVVFSLPSPTEEP